MRHQESNIEEHARLGHKRLNTPVFGRIAVSVLVVLIVAALLLKLSVPFPGYISFGLVIVVELILVLRRVGKYKLAVALQLELDRLKQQEFDLRFEEAKLNGELKKWRDET